MDITFSTAQTKVTKRSKLTDNYPKFNKTKKFWYRITSSHIMSW